MMRKLLFILSLVFASCMFSSVAHAQNYTQVSGTVTDADGIPYSAAKVTATIVVPSGGVSPYVTATNTPIDAPFPATADNVGHFTMRVPNNASITPASTQWAYGVAEQGIPLPFGNGPVSFSVTFTISGATQDIGATLTAAAPLLTNFAGSGTGSVISFSSGSLSPLFTTSVATPTTSPALSFNLSNAAANKVFGNCTTSTAQPSYCSITAAMLPATYVTAVTGTSPIVSSGGSTPAISCPTCATGGNISLGLNQIGVGTGSNGIGGNPGGNPFTWTSTGSGGTLTVGNANAYITYNSGSSNLEIVSTSAGNTGQFQIVCGNIGCINGTNIGGTPLVTFYGGSIGELQWNGLADSLSWFGATSGVAGISVAAVAGTPCTILLPTTSATAGYVLSAAAPSGGSCQTSWVAQSGGGGSGTVTSVAETITGGILSVSGSPVTTSGTFAITVAGTSGGIPYFSSASGWASSGVLGSGQFVLGGGAGSTPTSANLSGDATTSGSAVVTNVKVNGVSYPASPSTNGIPVVTAAGTVTYEVPSNCTTAVTFSTSTHNFGCNATAVSGALTAPFIPYASGAQALSNSKLECSTDVTLCDQMIATVGASEIGIGSVGSGTGSAFWTGTGTSSGNRAAMFSTSAYSSVGVGDTSDIGTAYLTTVLGNPTLAFGGTTSGIAYIGAAAAAGSPSVLLIPTANPSGGNFLLGAAVVGSAYQTSWDSLLTDNGTLLAYVGAGGINAPNGGVSSGTAPTACGSATGCLAMTDASTAGTPTSGQAYIRADSTSGHLLYSINGSAEANLGILLGNCSSAASPAVCGSATAGSVALPTNAVSSSIVVTTTAVTNLSQIFAFTDDTLGTKLGVTCNSTVATLVGGLTISARTPGTSFTIANNVAIVANPLCVSYLIVN